MHMCLYVYVYVRIRVYMYIRAYVFICTYVYVCGFLQYLSFSMYKILLLVIIKHEMELGYEHLHFISTITNIYIRGTYL